MPMDRYKIKSALNLHLDDFISEGTFSSESRKKEVRRIWSKPKMVMYIFPGLKIAEYIQKTSIKKEYIYIGLSIC